MFGKNYISFFIFFLLLIPALLPAQKIALIDKSLKAPILYTDSVTLEHLDKGFFPVYAKDLDSVGKTLNWFRDLILAKKRSKASGYNITVGRSAFNVQTVHMAYGDRYAIALQTVADPIKATYQITNEDVENKKAVYKLKKIIGYINNNLSILKPVR